jgi:hypothetical protein
MVVSDHVGLKRGNKNVKPLPLSLTETLPCDHMTPFSLGLEVTEVSSDLERERGGGERVVERRPRRRSEVVTEARGCMRWRVADSRWRWQRCPIIELGFGGGCGDELH